MSMLIGRIEGLLGKEVKLTFDNGVALRGVLKQDKKGYVLVEKLPYVDAAHYFEIDRVTAITIRTLRTAEDEETTVNPID